MNSIKLLSKKNIFILVILLIIILGVSLVFNYINSQQTIRIEYKNISKVTLREVSNGARSLGKEITFSKSGNTIKIPKGRYQLKFSGDTGYASDYKTVNLEDKPVFISLDPDYSKQKLDSLLDNEVGSIQSTLMNKYRGMTDYNIQRGKLYKKGQWYATTLQYHGSDVFNYDTLRLVMEKKGDTWQLVTNPPSIILTKQDFPYIPLEVLNDVNNAQNSVFIQEYSDPNGTVYFP